MPKVLIVEDSWDEQNRYKRKLGRQVEVVSAEDAEEALKMYRANPDIALIVMDGCLGSSFNTEPLVRTLRQTFAGPMIGASNSFLYQNKLVAAGCSHQADKDFVPQMVLDLLGLKAEEEA